ncbi:MAG TPA: PDZ domain-containing protein [Planctomycetes bacterium]|nr:PDZ domain-containing protein [Planctomycetota bacterium]HIN79613.1 PDZ domain-containing protein [Planctomycetota bacterium]
MRDVIVSVNGRPTPNLEELQAILENHCPGDRVKVGLLRGETRRVIVTVLQQPPE